MHLLQKAYCPHLDKHTVVICETISMMNNILNRIDFYAILDFTWATEEKIWQKLQGFAFWKNYCHRWDEQ